MLYLFATTVFVSAALLFVIQPLFAKMVLPLLGGSPSVWNTALVFYQATLLAGYVYAHLSTRALGVRRQAVLHILIVLAPLLILPIHIAPGWAPPTSVDPIPWLLLLLTGVVGLPFFAVSASAPLLQRWFTALRLPCSDDPYFLYAASNAGSFLALLSYPLILEPLVPLSLQAEWWAAGYAFFVVLIVVSAVQVLRAKEPPPSAPAATALVSLRDWLASRARWLLFAFIPSSLMVGVTTHVSMELAAVPLLWIAPLSLYLLSFVLVFARRPPPHRLFLRMLPIIGLAVTFLFAAKASEPVGFVIVLHLVMLFVASMVCHGELARSRPPVDQLTEFYLWMAAGGVLGGAFNALVAPLIFREITEYPLMIVATLLVAPLGGGRAPSGSPREAAATGQPGPERTVTLSYAGDIAFAVALGLLTAMLVTTIDDTTLEPRVKAMVAFGVPALVAFGSSRRALRFGLSVAAILLVAQYVASVPGQVAHSERTFFGVHRVTVDSTGSFRQLLHGRVMHGRQSVDPARSAEPIGYYGYTSPLGQVLTSVARRPARVAVIGLGNGTVAAYGLPGEAWTFFEIDPAVERIARDRRWFTYLANSPASVDVVLGDGRLSLAAARDRYDVVILDAYSSEAIPVHLLTREAMQVYLSRLAPHGVIAFNTSNRHFNLVPVVAALARDLGLACRVRLDVRNERDLQSGYVSSEWVLVARDVADLGSLTSDPRWQAVPPTEPAWTDDHSRILRALR